MVNCAGEVTSISAPGSNVGPFIKILDPLIHISSILPIHAAYNAIGLSAIISQRSCLGDIGSQAHREKEDKHLFKFQ